MGISDSQCLFSHINASGTAADVAFETPLTESG
jgi:hypothetical protein